VQHESTAKAYDSDEPPVLVSDNESDGGPDVKKVKKPIYNERSTTKTYDSDEPPVLVSDSENDSGPDIKKVKKTVVLQTPTSGKPSQAACLQPEPRPSAANSSSQYLSFGKFALSITQQLAKIRHVTIQDSISEEGDVIPMYNSTLDAIIDQEDTQHNIQCIESITTESKDIVLCLEQDNADVTYLGWDSYATTHATSSGRVGHSNPYPVPTRSVAGVGGLQTITEQVHNDIFGLEMSIIPNSNIPNILSLSNALRPDSNGKSGIAIFTAKGAVRLRSNGRMDQQIKNMISDARDQNRLEGSSIMIDGVCKEAFNVPSDMIHNSGNTSPTRESAEIAEIATDSVHIIHSDTLTSAQESTPEVDSSKIETVQGTHAADQIYVLDDTITTSWCQGSHEIYGINSMCTQRIQFSTKEQILKTLEGSGLSAQALLGPIYQVYLTA
jgi:hypothetical protein